MKPLIICEIGINHHGSVKKAMRMIDKAKESGADIAKFQYYLPKEVLGLDSPYLSYALECFFTKDQHEALAFYCRLIGIEYMVSVFNFNDIPWANKISARHKVASRMNKDDLFIRGLLLTGKEVIISIQPGCAKPYSSDNIRYMQCVTEYPTPAHKLKHLEHSDGTGLSSHCPDIQPTIEACKKGALTIENHVCESRDEQGCDIPASLTFDEYKEMIKEIKALG